MVRDVLVTSAAAHAHRLIDPYGPDRLKDRFHN